MTIGTKRYGANIKLDQDAIGRTCLCAVIWFLRTPKTLGYRYVAVYRWGISIQ